MKEKSRGNLKVIRFAGELLPNWAQLLDLASSLCPVSEDVRHWFFRFTFCSGADDARIVTEHCIVLRAQIQENRAALLAGLHQNFDATQPSQIIQAWIYALDTMILAAQSKKTCAWTVEGSEDVVLDDSDGGDVTLNRA